MGKQMQLGLGQCCYTVASFEIIVLVLSRPT